MAPKKAAAPSASIPNVQPNALKGKTVIITGDVEGFTRVIAQKVLESAGATFAKSLNKSVNLVVLGENAGPKKLEKIEELGIESREWDDVIEEIKVDGSDDGGEAKEPEPKAEPEPKSEPESESEAESKAKGKAKKAAPAKKAAAKKEKPAAKAEPKAKTKAASAKGSASGTGLASDFSIDGKRVLVTGTVAGYTRKTANDLLESHGAEIAKTLNADLDLVILGAKPGPDKMAKIEELQLQTVQWKELGEQLGLEYGGEEDDEEEPEPQTLSGAPDSVDDTLIIITGTVDGHTRTTAEKALQEKGAKIAKTLNNTVELVVLGVNPGPDKIRKINDLGIPTCEWDDLAKKLDLPGPSEPPKKKKKKT